MRLQDFRALPHPGALAPEAEPPMRFRTRSFPCAVCQSHIAHGRLSLVRTGQVHECNKYERGGVIRRVYCDGASQAEDVLYCLHCGRIRMPGLVGQTCPVHGCTGKLARVQE